MNPLVNSPAGQKALESMVKIVPFTPPGTIHFRYPELENAFIKEDIPFVIQWASTEKASMDPLKSEIVGKVEAALVPGAKYRGKIHHRPGMPTGWTLGIPKYAKNKDAAIHVLYTVSKPESALDIWLSPDSRAFCPAGLFTKGFISSSKYTPP